MNNNKTQEHKVVKSCPVRIVIHSGGNQEIFALKESQVVLE